MEWLVFIHVLSAIIGIGPTFFGLVLIRNNQSLEQLRYSLKLLGWLDFFPKIGGTLAVISGISLFVLNDYGSILQLWLVGSLALYVLIQVIVIGFLAPTQKSLARWVYDLENENAVKLPPKQKALLARANSLLYSASLLGVVLFFFMIVKP